MNKRLLAVDILRGITIAGMLLVNNPGTWEHIYTPLEHAEWIGLTPTDLVFPFFMFVMGVSMYFSLRKYDFKMSKRAMCLELVNNILPYVQRNLHYQIPKLRFWIFSLEVSLKVLVSYLFLQWSFVHVFA